jgi:hypothetical protein
MVPALHVQKPLTAAAAMAFVLSQKYSNHRFSAVETASALLVEVDQALTMTLEATSKRRRHYA